MARKGENIRKRADGRWEGRYILHQDGITKIKSVYAPTYKEVKQKLIKQKHIVAEQAVLSSKETSQEDKAALLTLGKVAEEWLMQTESQVGKEMKYSTYAKYKYVYIHYIESALGCCCLKELTDTYVQEHLDNSLSQSTNRSIYCVLNQMIDFAAAKYHLQMCSFTKNTSKISKNGVTTLNISEQTRLVQYLQYDMDVYKLGVYICLFTGLRLGEVCALQWSDIDMDLKLLHVNRTVQRIAVSDGDKKTSLVETSPKSFYSKREIPISEQLYVLLKEFYCSEKYILNGNTPMEPRTMQNKFKQYLQQIGIPNTNFHTLRHTFATNCIQMGADIKSISEVLGHSDIKITLNRYVHPSIETKRGYMNSLSHICGQKNGQLV